MYIEECAAICMTASSSIEYGQKFTLRTISRTFVGTMKYNSMYDWLETFGHLVELYRYLYIHHRTVLVRKDMET